MASNTAKQTIVIATRKLRTQHRNSILGGPLGGPENLIFFNRELIENLTFFEPFQNGIFEACSAVVVLTLPKSSI